MMRSVLRALMLALVVLIATVAASGCGGGGSTKTAVTHTLTGTVSIDASEVLAADVTNQTDLVTAGRLLKAVKSNHGPTGLKCPASLGLATQIGSQVVVKNANGATIGVAELAGGDFMNNESCRFSFRIPSLPTSTFYSVSVDGLHGAQTFSESKLAAGNWSVTLH